VILSKTVENAWGVDLSGETADEKDGFLVGGDPIYTMFCKGEMWLINNFPRPYMENLEKAAEEFTDLRMRDLFLNHKAWFSIDAMGVEESTTEEQVRAIYRKLGPLFADLLDDQCLLIFLPESGRAFPINDDTDAALRSEDPVGELSQTSTVPIIQVPDDDPEMVKAVAQARKDWPQFVAAFEAGKGETFAIKAPVTHEDHQEFIWIKVLAIEGDRIHGTLENEPANLGPLIYGSKVTVPLGDLNDWVYIDETQNRIGGFTVAVIMNAAIQRKDKNKKTDQDF